MVLLRESSVPISKQDMCGMGEKSGKRGDLPSVVVCGRLQLLTIICPLLLEVLPALPLDI